MKIDRFIQLLNIEKNCWTLAGLFLALAVLISLWCQGLETKIEMQKREYQLDQTLSKNKAQYETRFQRILAEGPVVETRPMNQNEWVRQTQSQIRERQLALRELSPMAGDNNKLMLAIEGDITSFLQYLMDVAKLNQAVFVEKFNITRSSDDGKRIRAEFILAQG